MEFSTDGHSVSVLMRKPTQPGDERSQQHDDPAAHQPAPSSEGVAQGGDSVEMWGIDPGAIDLFHAVNQNGEHVSYSTKQYRELSKQTASTKTGNAWVKGDANIQGFWDGLPEVKTSRVQQLSAHIKYVLRNLPWVLDWYMNKPFRMLRFRRYVMAERTFAGICARLTAKSGHETTVGFGDWSNQDAGGILRIRGPVKKLIARLTSRCRVVMIDEFHTSKLHNACGQSMTNAYCHKHAKQSPRGQSGTSDRVHQVLICSNRCCPGPAARMGMHRDKNAAMNMLCLLRLQLRNQPRPPHFTRGADPDQCHSAPFV